MSDLSHKRIEIDHVTSKDAAAAFGVSNDYIARLCRQKKLRGILDGRTWIVEIRSLEAFFGKPMVLQPGADPKSLFRIGVDHVTSKDAAKAFGVTHDYVARLCRQGKLQGVLEGRTWMIEAQSLEDFFGKQLPLGNAVAPVAPAAIPEIAVVRAETQRVAENPFIQRLTGAIRVTTLSILLVSVLALGAGSLVNKSPVLAQRADQIAAVGGLSIFGGIANTARSVAYKVDTFVYDLLYQGLPTSNVFVSTTVKPKTTTVRPPTTIVKREQPVTQMYVNNPIVERIIERGSGSGASEEFITQHLGALEDRLRSLYFASNATQGAATQAVYNVVSHTNKIDSLSGVDITNSLFANGTIRSSDIISPTISDASMSGTTSISLLVLGATTTASNGFNISDGCFAVDGVCITGSGGSGTPGGSDTQVQFNDGGAFAGSAAFTFSTSSNQLVVTNSSSTNATTSKLYTTTFAGAGLTNCSSVGQKVLWNSTTMQFECGTDLDSGASGFSTTSANYWAEASTTLVKTYSNNTFTGTNTFANITATGATTTSLSTGIASTSLLVISNVSNALLNTASNGTVQATTFSGPLSFTGGVLTLSQANGSADGYLSSSDWTSFNSRLSTTSLGLFDKGYFFSTTSATQFASVGLAFSTTSASYFLTQNTGAAFSTTSVEYWANGSTTLPKTYSSNTFTGTNMFNAGLLSLASTTIGNGTATGGLTISGGATTTGNLLVQGTTALTGALTSSATAPNTLPYASSTALTVSGTTYLTGLTNSVLSTNAAGQVVATTSIGAGYISGQLGTINGTTFNRGDSITVTAASSTLLANSNTWTGVNTFSGNTTFTNATSTTLNTTVLGIGGTNYFTSLTGSGLVNTAGVLTLDRTGDWTGTLDGQEGSYYLANSFSTTSASYFLTQNTGAAFSTTSVEYWANGSTTLPKTYSSNTFTGTNMFNAGLLSLASTTIGNGTATGGLTISGGATTTGNLLVQGSATSTSFFSTTASSTNLFSNSATIGSLTAGSGIFSAALSAYASSTIGNGTQIGGLTISGGATTTGSFLAAGTARVASTFSLSTVISCTGGQALQTDGSGNVACGSIAVGGASSGGGWTTNNGGRVTLSTTTDLVVVGASTTPYAKLAVLSGSSATTTLALVAASGQSANILDVWDSTGALSTVLTSDGKLGLGTSSPFTKLSVVGNGYINGTLDATGLATFSSGLVSYASSTIGAGSTTTGLTISGGATTTGNAYFASKVGIGTSSPSAKLTIDSTETTGTSLFLNASSTTSGTGFTTWINSNIMTSGGRALTIVDTTYNSSVFEVNRYGQTGVRRFGAIDGSTSLEVGTAFDSFTGLAVIANSASQSANLQEWRNSSNASLSAVNPSGYLGIGTSTPTAQLSIFKPYGNTNATLFSIASSTNAANTTNTSFLSVSSTGFGTTTLSGLNVSGSATSTSNVGFNITTGCFAVNGTCVTSGSSASTTLFADVNTWTGLQTFANITATNSTTTSFGINSETFTDLTGNGLTNTAGVLTVNTGQAFSTTSANFWSSAGLGFSTTSSNYWSSVGLGFSTTSANTWSSFGLGFSTTSSNYWATQGLGFSTTSTDYYHHASTTVPTMYKTNTFTGLNTFSAGLLSLASSTIGAGSTTTGLTILGSATSTYANAGGNANLFNFWNNASATSSGAQTLFKVTDANGNATTTSAITSILTQNYGAGTGDLAFSVLKSGTLTEALRINNTGILSIPFGFISSASSSFTTLNGVAATTTSFFSTTASSTNLFSNAATIGSGTIGSLTSNTGTITYASSTALTVSGTGYFGTASTTNLLATHATTTSFGINSETFTDLTGSGLVNTAGVLSVDPGQAFSTTSASFFSSVGLAFSTTSSNHHASVGLSFSTTSASYFLSQNLGNAFSTTSVNYWAEASTTLVKTYSNNTFTGTNSFQNITATGATTTSLSTGIASTTALTISGIQNSILSTNGTGGVVATSTPTALSFNATSNTASQFPYASSTAISVSGTAYFGTATSTNLFSNAATFGAATIGNATLAGGALSGTYTGSPTFSGVPIFSGGFISQASTTIGNGTQTGGLTILGGATTTANLHVAGTTRLVSTLSLDTVISCVGGSALQTDGSGVVSCGTISVASNATAGGWTTNNIGKVSLATTTDLVVVGASSTPYAKLAILSGAAATTTLALVPATSQTANIIDIYGTNGILSSVFTAGGKFGIGSSSPLAKLAVHANATETNTRLFEIASSTNSATTTLLVVTNAGQVGIGTNAPTYPLAVVASRNAASLVSLQNTHAAGISGLEIFNNSGTRQIAFGWGNASESLFPSSGFIGTTGNSPFILTTAATERVRIDSVGNVGIGTTNPTTALEVAGTTTATVFESYDTTSKSTFPYASSTALSVSGTGYFVAASTTNFTAKNATTTSFGINSETFTDLTGTGLTNTAGVLSVDPGQAFSTTSANFWSSVGLGFSTTSANTWASFGLGFSTTSSNYWATQGLGFSTTSTDYYHNASTTVPTTYKDNTFTGGNLFLASTTIGAGTSITGLTISGWATTTGTSTSMGGLQVGTSTNHGFLVYNNTARAGNGLAIRTTAAGSGVTLATLSSETNEDFSIRSKGSGAVVLADANGSGRLSVGSTMIQMLNSPRLVVTPSAHSSSALAQFSFVGGTNTNITTASEAHDVQFNLAQTKTHANGNIALQRSFIINAPTEAMSSMGAGRITDAATLSVTSAPLTGDFASTTNSYGILVGSSTASTMFNASTTNSYGLGVFTSAGASNTYSAVFMGGNVGVGTTTPSARLSIFNPHGSTDTTLFSIASSTSATNGTNTSFLSVSSTGYGTTTLSGLAISGSATSTSNVGFNLSAGCYAINGTCLSDSTASSTLLADVNTWTGLQTFANITAAGATTTSFFTATASSTNLFSNAATIGSLTAGTGAFSGAITSTATGANTFPYASSTALSVSGTSYFSTATSTSLFANTATIGSLTSGTGSFSSTLGVTGLSTLSGGVASYASSTIGNGTATGGLTISGGATTTGNAYFAGNVGIGTTSPAKTFAVNGDIFSNGNGYFTAAQASSLGTLNLGAAGAANGGINFYNANTATGVGLVGFAHNSAAGDFRIFSGGGSGSILLSTGQGAELYLSSQSGGNNGSNIGISTSSPYARLSIHANPTDSTIATTLFAIASSTSNSTTTLFAISNTGALTQLGGASSSFSNGFNITTGCYAVNGTCLSSSSASSTLLQSDTNTFTNLTTFTGGIRAFASSTIGAGGATTGLTISGGATTTGNAYFAGRVGIGTTTPSSLLSIKGSDTSSGSKTLNITNSSDTNLLSVFNDGKVVANFLNVGNTAGSTAWLNLAGSDSSPLMRVNSNTGAEVFRMDASGNFGLSTSTPSSSLSIFKPYGNTNSSLFDIASSTNSANTTNTSFLSVSSTGFGTTTLSGLAISGSATSTSNVGFNLSAGCYAINGTCLSDSTASSTLLADVNTWTGLQTFANITATGATTTSFFTTTASSTNLFSNAATIGTLTGGTGSFSSTLGVTGLSSLTGGLVSYASSTIGAGTQTTGLTISGGATTTGNIYYGGGIFNYSTYATSTVRNNSTFAWSLATSSTTTLPILSFDTTSGSEVAILGTDLHFANPATNIRTANGTSMTFGKAGATDKIGFVNNVGFGTSTSHGTTVSIFKPYNETNSVLFSVASSTNAAGTTKTAFLSVSSTGFGTTTLSGLEVSGSATSTSNVGFNITTGCYAVNGTCLSSGSSASSTLLSDVNTWSSLNIFNAGLLSLASTTIGSGTQSGGLTISGGATTTLNAYFGGSVGIGTTSPYRALSVVGTTTSTGGFSVDDNAHLLSYKGTTTISVLGTNNFFAGREANGSSTKATGSSNLFVGHQAGYGATASNSVYLGFFSGYGTSTGRANSGNANTAVGYLTMQTNTTGTSNAVLGASALRFNETGVSNVAVGSSALNANVSGSYNVAVGGSSSGNNVTGFFNTAVGYLSLFSNTSGGSNVAIGRTALYSNTSGSSSVAIGRSASYGNTDANETVAIGYQAAGTTNTFAAANYVAIGSQAGYNLGNGSGNSTLIGYQSGFNSSGFANIGLGASSTANITTGAGNMGLGNNTYFASATANNQLNIGNLIFGTLPATSTGWLLPTSGSVGIGTTSPTSKFGIAANSGDTLTALFQISSSTANSTSTHVIVANTGNVGLGTSTSPLANLVVQNNYGSTNANIFQIASSTASTGNTQTNFLSVSSTGFGTTTLSGLSVSGSATSTSNVGFNITTGCYAVNGTCLSSSASLTGTTGQTAYFSGTNTAIGTSTLFISTASKVGIATSSPIATLDIFGDAILSGPSRYINFATSTGSSGYGFRDNAGTLEFKNYGGTWQGVTTATSGPSFSVHRNAVDTGALTPATFTVLDWTTENFDTNNNFDLSNDRFQPTVPGKYIITGSISFGGSGTDGEAIIASIHKNGSRYAEGITRRASVNSDGTVVSAVIDFNGTSDYVDLRAFSETSGVTISGYSFQTNFTGAMIAPVNATAGGWTNDGTQSFLSDSTDRVGVGTSTPWGKLAIQNNYGESNPFIFSVSSSTSAGGTSATNFLTVSSTGFGTTTLSGLNISGSATSTSNVGFNLTSGCFAISGTCLSSSSASSTLLQSDTNTFTNLTTFTGGIRSFASSTIGAGATTTGLTISGGATTTGVAYFGNRVGIGTSSPMASLSILGTGNSGINLGGYFGSGYGAISLNGTVDGVNYNILSGNSSTDNSLYLNRPSGGAINFREANGTSQLQIATGGNVGVATTTSVAKLAVQGGDQLAASKSFEVSDSTGAKLAEIFNDGLTKLKNLLVTASSTIGGGTQTTGLTINGGATTTGALVVMGTQASSTFDGNVEIDGALKVGTGSIYLNGAATSTFSAGVQFSAINVTSSSASSTFANGIQLTNGCFYANGVCLTKSGIDGTLLGTFATSTPGTTTVQLTGAAGSAPSFSSGVLTLPSNTSYFEVELWGAGGGGSGSGTSAPGNGAAGGSSCFGTNSIACASATITATAGAGGAWSPGNGGAGGDGSGGDVNISGGAGGGEISTPSASAFGHGGGTGGSAARGGGGGKTTYNAAGSSGSAFGGGGGGGGCSPTNSCFTGPGGGGGGYAQKLIPSPRGTYYYTVGAGGALGAAGTSGFVGGTGGAGGFVVKVYTTVSANGTSGGQLLGIYSSSTPGSNVTVNLNGAAGSAPSFSAGVLTLPSNASTMIVKMWGSGAGGGSGSAGITGGNAGSSGNASSFGTGLATTTANGGSGGGGGVMSGTNGGTGGTVGTSGDVNLAGGSGIVGAGGNTTYGASGYGGGGASAPNGGGGGHGSTGTGGGFGGGGGGGIGVADASQRGGGGGGGGSGAYAEKLYTSPSGTYYYNIGAGGAGGTAVTSTNTSGAGGVGGAGGIVIEVYATGLTSGSVGTGTAGQFAYYNSAGTQITATSSLSINTTTGALTGTNGFNLTGGCFSVSGVCIGYVKRIAGIYATSTPGSNVSITKSAAGLAFSGSALTIPASTTEMVVEIWGGGGGGGGARTNGVEGGAGGGGGGYSMEVFTSVGSQYYYTIGSGGAGGSAGSNAGSVGNTSCFGTNSTACTSASHEASGGGGGAFGDVGSPQIIGGTGGSGTNGNVNMTGAEGGNSDNLTAATGANGGNGGTSPRGGGGGRGGAPTGNGSSDQLGEIGAAFGGGGGGGGGDGATGYAGARGGHGGMVITVYATSSPTAAGNDYAEMFPVSSPDITAADIVAVNIGAPIAMKKASKGDTLAGVIATQPGQILGDINAPGMRPVALMGRVPVKVNLEGGTIKVGDRIAVSSVAGVGKKAGMFDPSIGIAIANYPDDGTSPEPTADGTVMVFVTLQNPPTVAMIGDGLLATPESSDGYDFVGNLMNSIFSRVSSVGTSTSWTAGTSMTGLDAVKNFNTLYNPAVALDGSGTSSSTSNLIASTTATLLDYLAILPSFGKAISELDLRTASIENLAGTSTVLRIDQTGGVSIGVSHASTTPIGEYMLEVGGSVGAKSFVITDAVHASSTPVPDEHVLSVLDSFNVFATETGTGSSTRLSLDIGTLPSEFITGSGVDLYQLGLFNMAGLKALNNSVSHLASSTAAVSMRVIDLEEVIEQMREQSASSNSVFGISIGIATTSAAELTAATTATSATSSISTSTPWIGSFSTTSSRMIERLSSFTDTVFDVLGRAVYATVGVFDELLAKEITAVNVHATNVYAEEKICIGETCVTEAELQELLGRASNASAEQASEQPASSSTPQSTSPQTPTYDLDAGSSESAESHASSTPDSLEESSASATSTTAVLTETTASSESASEVSSINSISSSESTVIAPEENQPAEQATPAVVPEEVPAPTE